MSTNELAVRAKELYERAMFGGDEEALTIADRELDAAEADLALARGRIVHARFLRDRQEDPRELPLFEQAAELYRRLGDERGEAEALFWIGCYHQVVRGSHEAALEFLERSYRLATATGDDLTTSYAVRHLGFADLAAGDFAAARLRFEESVRLRRKIDFRPGVAAGLLALAELASETGDRDEELALLDEAEAIAKDSGAHGTLRWIERARNDLRQA
ncbi:tetratricopeptide repeat protein [Lentzea sp. NPDC004789]